MASGGSRVVSSRRPCTPSLARSVSCSGLTVASPRLGGTAAEPVALTGWDNEGAYELIDTSAMNTPGWYQLNLTLDPGAGTAISHPSLSDDLQRLRLTDGMLGEFDYIRVPA